MKRIREVNHTFFLTVIMSLIASFVLGIISTVIDNPMILMILNQIMLVIPAAVFVLRQPEKPAELLGIHKIRWINVPLLILLQFLLIPVISCLNLVTMLFSDNVISGTVQDIVGTNSLLMSIVCIALIPCLVEEIIFRGVIYYAGYRGVSPVKGMFLCGLLFGLLHLNINQFSYAFVLGVVLCLAVEATGSLVSAMLMHFTLNANSTILTYLSARMIGWLENVSPETVQAETEIPVEAVTAYLGFYLIIAAVCTILAFLLLKTIAKNSGRYEHLKGLFRRPSPTTWEAEEWTQEEPVRMATPALLAGILICGALIILMQSGILA